jgi:hypothetical protein
VDHVADGRLEAVDKFFRRLLIAGADGLKKFFEFRIFHVRFSPPGAFPW